MDKKKLNRLKLVLVEKDKTGVWLAEQLGVWRAVLTLPLVNLNVAVNGQDAPLGEVLHEFQMCRVATLHSYPLRCFFALGEVVHCHVHRKEQAINTVNHFCFLSNSACKI